MNGACDVEQGPAVVVGEQNAYAALVEVSEDGDTVLALRTVEPGKRFVNHNESRERGAHDRQEQQQRSAAVIRLGGFESSTPSRSFATTSKTSSQSFAASRMFWTVERLQTTRRSCGTYRRPLRTRAAGASGERSSVSDARSMSTRPASCRTKPAAILYSVLFPLPFTPANATMPLLPTRSETSSNTVRTP